VVPQLFFYITLTAFLRKQPPHLHLGNREERTSVHDLDVAEISAAYERIEPDFALIFIVWLCSVSNIKRAAPKDGPSLGRKRPRRAAISQC
jgi:hypothetical protein